MNYEESNDTDETSEKSETVLSNIFTAERFKVAIALIIIYFITTTNMFIDLALSKIPGTLDQGKITTKGNLLCAALIVIVFFLSDIAAKAGYI